MTIQDKIFIKIAEALLVDYSSVYYVNAVTNEYYWYSMNPEFHSLNLEQGGDDFFQNLIRDCRQVIYEEDQHIFLQDIQKEKLLGDMKKGTMQSIEYRLVINGVPTWHALRLIFVLGVMNIDAEMQAQLTQKENRRKRITFTQIAETLASHYDLIYYIDRESSHYAEFSTKRISGELKIQEEGDDFFATAQTNVDRFIYPADRDRIRLFLDRDHLISQLESLRQLTEDYRMITDSGKPQYTRMSVTYSTDRSHFIICVENRDKDVRREKEHLAALNSANEMARRDALTGTRNKTAYHEMEKELQALTVDGGEPFGLVICDINSLKIINDTEGHRAGDDYIKASCKLICRTWHHSPVFRVGGDEFVVVLRGRDFANRESLLSNFRRQVEENLRFGEGTVIASGLAEFQPLSDRSVEDVFNRADNQMYEDKARLKRQKLLLESHSLKEKAVIQVISEERRIKIDALFKAFEVVSEGTYVYLCDMKYDFSRWSRSAVDTFGLPSEYMYGAGDIWENHIHPEDRAAYHRGIDDIFSGNAAGHDMQYRARRADGKYEVCTCRGVVIRDQDGNPDYFAGTIRNHGIQGHIDTLTGLRNQYGFFEDLDSCIKRSTEISVILFGISKFSEINEMYGYHFGNRVLQLYARQVFETTGNTGHSYRIDGTKFAVISNTLTVSEMRDNYERFRAFLHEDFVVDGKKVLLDPHCGALRVDRFDVDSQTVYACLNFANEESKLRQHGDLVEFKNDGNGENQQRLEKLHAIRASIMHGYEGFYLLYQPVVDAKTEKLIGAEALLRWKNDTYGMVPPDQFIPLLESDPLFPELGEWSIREGHPDRAGRFRDRLLLRRHPQGDPAGRHQDRPQLRAEHRGQRGRPRPCAQRRGAVQHFRREGLRRGRRDRGHAGYPAELPCGELPGLLLRKAPPGREAFGLG